MPDKMEDAMGTQHSRSSLTGIKQTNKDIGGEQWDLHEFASVTPVMCLFDGGEKIGYRLHLELVCDDPFMPGARLYSVPTLSRLFPLGSRISLLPVCKLSKGGHSWSSRSQTMNQGNGSQTSGLWVTGVTSVEKACVPRKPRLEHANAA